MTWEEDVVGVIMQTVEVVYTPGFGSYTNKDLYILESTVSTVSTEFLLWLPGDDGDVYHTL